MKVRHCPELEDGESVLMLPFRRASQHRCQSPMPHIEPLSYVLSPGSNQAENELPVHWHLGI